MKKGKLQKIQNKWYIGTVFYNEVWSESVIVSTQDVPKLDKIEEVFGDVNYLPLVDYDIALNPETFEPCAFLITRESKLKKYEKMAEESWEGCDGCDDNDKYFYVGGFVAAMFQMEKN